MNFKFITPVILPIVIYIQKKNHMKKSISHNFKNFIIYLVLSLCTLHLYFLEDTYLKKYFISQICMKNFYRYAIWKEKLKIINSKRNCKIYQTAQEKEVFFSNFTVILYQLC